MEILSALLVAVIGLLVKISRDIGRLRGSFDHHVEETDRICADHRSRLRTHGRVLRRHRNHLRQQAAVLERHDAQLNPG